MSAVLTVGGTSSSTEPQSSQTTLSDLWTQAVNEYRNTANLSKQEEQLLRHPYSAEQFLQLTKDEWDQTVFKQQSRHYETIRFAVFQVLGIFDVISPVLGLAGQAASQSCCFPHRSHGCLGILTRWCHFWRSQSISTSLRIMNPALTADCKESMGHL